MENISYFVKGLFRGVEETQAIKDQKLELESHIIDHMNDLIAGGMNKNDAFDKTVQGLGNLDELIDTMTGKKVFVPINKVQFFDRLVGFLYGIFYMTLIFLALWKGLPFMHNMSLLESLVTSLAGFSGYLVPFIIALVVYTKHPGKTEAVFVRSKSSVYTALAGWLGISSVCIIANVIMNCNNESNVTIWAWMPTLGILTWPIMECAYDYFVKRFAK